LKVKKIIIIKNKISLSRFLLFFVCSSFLIDVACVRLDAKANEQFSFKTFSGQGISYTNSIVNGKYKEGSTPYGPVSNNAKK
jgi:hypothetical protein